MQQTAQNEVTTWNNAKSLASSGNSCVNLFFKVLRQTSEHQLRNYLRHSWHENKLDTLKLIFHLRDCRGGKGEKLQFIRSLLWLMEKDRETFNYNLQFVPEYGCWKDLLKLIDNNNNLREQVLDLFVKQLLEDENNDQKSLVAKWIPTENSHYDKKLKTTSYFTKRLNKSRKNFRRYIVNLRNKLNVVEQKMCANDWNNIEYSKTPSRSLLLYRNAFQRHDRERYEKWLEDIKNNKDKINVSQIFPHELVRYYINCGNYDETIERQWQELVKNVKNNFKDSRAVCVCDTSGSMSSDGNLPISVAVSLSLLVSEIMPEPFNKQIITFSNEPRFVYIQSKTLQNKVKEIIGMDWGFNTDIQKVFDLICNVCKKNNLSEESMPKRLYIFSDMQFDNATISGQSVTNHSAMREKYIKNGYNPPEIIYWNLNGSSIDFPTTSDDNGIALVSGFSPALVELFIEGENMNPYKIMRKAIDNPRYSKLEVKN